MLPIETERFIIRPLLASDSSGMYALDSNPAVHRFLGNNPIKTEDQAEDMIVKIQEQYQRHGMGRLAIIDKVTQDFIGWTGIKYEQNLRTDRNYYDLGYRLREEYWGQGIATETAIASLKHGFIDLGLDKICAAADVLHHASNAILKKVGLQLIEQFTYDNLLHNWYELERSEWLDRQK